jgi:anti-sigma regulatory factor (Ser/Thr protein kinase)
MRDSRPTLSRQSIAPDLNAPAAARLALERFRGQLEDDVFERSALVLSEVVTNSVKHAGLTAAQPIDLEIGLTPERLRVEITDDGHGFEPLAVTPGRHDGSGGWGLWLVEGMTDRWGVDFTHSTRV